MPDVSTDPAVLARRAAFGRRLRALREQAGKTQADLAAAAGLRSRAFYVQVEAGKRNISLDRVFAIAAALGVDVTELFADPES